MKIDYPEDLPNCLWFCLPVLVALFPYVMRVINVETDQYVFGEQGIIENYTFVVLFIAIVLGVLSVIKMKSFEFPFFKYWLI